jgi:hypothetical protein
MDERFLQLGQSGSLIDFGEESVDVQTLLDHSP